MSCRGWLALQYLIDLRDNFSLDIGIESHHVETEGKRDGRRFMTSQKERDEFVAKLQIAHLAAVFVPGSQQTRKQVIAIRTALLATHAIVS